MEMWNSGLVKGIMKDVMSGKKMGDIVENIKQSGRVANQKSWTDTTLKYCPLCACMFEKRINERGHIYHINGHIPKVGKKVKICPKCKTSR